MRALRPFAAALCASALLAVGCASAAPADDADVSEDELRPVTLRVEVDAQGGVTLDDSPRFKSRARGGLTCSERFELDGRVRYGCSRGEEWLEIIAKEPGRALVMHKAAGRGSDKRAFFACSGSAGQGALPERMRCSPAPLRDRGGNGGLSSPFDSTVDGISIPNTHAVGLAGGSLLRGMAPRSPAQFDELIAADVGAVLIFKNATGRGDEIGDERDAFVARGVPGARVLHVPFQWKDLGGFREPCEQTVSALKFVADNLAAGRKTFFHCTVGEDRTGLLAAVRRLTTEDGLAADRAWDEEMCERGYGAGNPLKPSFVVRTLATNLAPLYRKMAYLAVKGRLDTLDASVCQTDPTSEPDFEATAVARARLECGTSTRFEP
ncbi:MAG: tyrosine-protein phosphatase [Polyangiaceae bacterium]